MKSRGVNSSKHKLFNRITALLITSWIFVVAVVVETTEEPVKGEELSAEVFMEDIVK
jgi:hypothetical protein